jgi:hypothetical protein
MRTALEGAGIAPVRVVTPTWLVPEHTRDELAAELALRRVPRPLAGAVESLYRRRGIGAVVLAAGRVA